MCDPGTLVIIATVASVAGTVAKTAAAYQQKRYEAKVAQANQKAENARILDAMNRGDVEVRDAARRQGQLMGAQRAAMAANGIDVSFGSPSDILADTAMYGREDQMTIRENTRREIMGYDINAANFGAQRNAAKSAATGALIAGGLEVVSTIAGGAQRYGATQTARSGAAAGAGG